VFSLFLSAQPASNPQHTPKTKSKRQQNLLVDDVAMFGSSSTNRKKRIRQ
jgi:hypothetical protein